MAKKTKWWFSDDGDQSVLFPNTVKQHNEKILPVYHQGELISGDDYDEYEDYYGWGKKPVKQDVGQGLNGLNIHNGANKRDRKEWLKNESNEFSQDWEKKWTSNSWKGYSYYRVPTLTYRYVQQMANALASQHKIQVKVGNEWVCDLTTKTLTYNPATLVYSSKSELLATLLHEIGKLRYSKSMSELKYEINGDPRSPFLDKYGILSYSAMMPFEELRIDTKMLGEYGSAGEIYESQEPALQIVYENYKRLSQSLKEITVDVAGKVFNDMLEQATMDNATNQQFEITMRAKLLIKAGLDENQAIAQAINEIAKSSMSADKGNRTRMMDLFGVGTRAEAEAEFQKMRRAIMAKDTLYDYIASMYSEAYVLKRDSDFSTGMVDRIKKTAPSFKPIVKHTDAVEVLAEMDKNVYPVIEDLLREAQQGSDELNGLGDKFKNEVGRQMKNMMQSFQESMGMGMEGNQKVRLSKNSGQTNDTTVPEWFNGDYRTLKDSVRGEITRLTRMLTFLKRTEQQVRWVSNQRRGRLNMKKLYRAKLGNRKVFKSKLETVDTVRSFAFSILLDVSGSMAGPRMANTTRGMVILAEVFKDMAIPFEIVTFSDGAKTIKEFEGAMDSKVEKKIGGLPKCDGGGTNLNKGINIMKLKERTERNKICIVLTDGGVGNQDMYNRDYFAPMLQKDHIKSLAFGLEISQNEIGRLCNGTGVAIKNAVEVPYIFSDLLKSLMVKK